jgi:hypothetical protein
MSATSAFAGQVIMANVLIHSSVPGCFQFSQIAATPKGWAVFHRNRVRLLRLRAFDSLPLEEIINRQDAAPQLVGVAEHRQCCDGLCLGVDRFAADLFRPIWDQAPPEAIERACARIICAPSEPAWMSLINYEISGFWLPYVSTCRVRIAYP